MTLLETVGKVFETCIQLTNWEYFTIRPKVGIQDGGLQTINIT